LSLQPTRALRRQEVCRGLRAGWVGSPLGTEVFDLCGLARVTEARRRFESI